MQSADRTSHAANAFINGKNIIINNIYILENIWVYCSDKIRERYNRRITKYQEIAAVLVNVSTVILIYILVDFTGLGYMHNVLGNSQFRICCLVLVVEGMITELTSVTFCPLGMF